MHPEAMTDPPNNWIERLRRGHNVWLVKENTIAKIEFPYEPPEPGYYTGRIGVRYGLLHSWFIDKNGNGIDGSLLMLPMLNNLPDNPDPLPEPLVRQFQREMEDMRDRLGRMEGTLHELCVLIRGGW
jgi:hypothetical protein